MINREILIKQIIYRSIHRGSKEMDILLGNFVKTNIEKLNDEELHDLSKLLSMEDEILYKWYFDKNLDNKFPNNKVSLMLKNFKI